MSKRTSLTTSEQPRVAVVSEITAIFYTSVSPDSRPFVEVGQTVVPGQTLGILEAMKVFNEISLLDDKPMVVETIVAATGKVVPEGGVIMYLRPVN